MEENFIIEGVTIEGNTFRPSDWIDRLCSVVGSFNDDKRLVYSPLAYPLMYNNRRSLFVSIDLKMQQPEMFQHIIDFVSLNKLKCTPLSDAKDN